MNRLISGRIFAITFFFEVTCGFSFDFSIGRLAGERILASILFLAVICGFRFDFSIGRLAGERILAIILFLAVICGFRFDFSRGAVGRAHSPKSFKISSFVFFFEYSSSVDLCEVSWPFGSVSHDPNFFLISPGVLFFFLEL